MHIKNIHCIIEKLAETTKVELDKGIENIDTKEMGEVADIIKDLAEAEYYAKISKAMDEAEYGEDYDYMGAYDEYERKGYRGQRRDSRGRYMSNRGRRGYESRMMPEMDWDDMEYQRDMDRNSHNRMYYTDGNMSGSSSMGGSQGQSSGSMGSQGGSRGYSDGGRDSREGRSGQSRRGYMEAKEKGADKQQKMKELEDYMKELSTDVTEMIEGASPEEKSMLKNKMQVLMQKIQ